MMLFQPPTPPIPNTGWTTPAEFPRLEAASAIGFDTETYDPNLLTHGPGWGRGDGHVVGLSVAVPTGEKWYFPMRHEAPDGSRAAGNLDPGMVLKWAQRELGRPTQTKVGANLEYDIGWLAQEGVEVRGKLIDVQYAEPLLDEHKHSYSLDSLAQQYLGLTKTDDALYDWLWRAYGGAKGRKQAANIYRSPVALAGPYGEDDAWLPLQIWEHQKKLLEEQGLTALFEMECALIPLYVARRMRGTRIDVAQAEKNRDILKAEEADIQARINKAAGRPINVNSSADLAVLFDADGISYPRTEKGAPSFTKLFLNSCPAPTAKLILQLRAKEKLRSTFLENAILDKQRNGRIYSQLHPLRSGDGGTVSGRYSSSMPNEQQAPSRSDEGKELIRGCYIPEDGDDWYSIDYSQIEPRLQFHYAKGPLAEALRARFAANPHLNCYHEMMRDMGEEAIEAMGGWKHGYKPFKSIWLGLSYGMGIPKMAAQMGVSEAQAREWVGLFPEYLKQLASTASTRAGDRGFIKTIGGRYARFPMWESRDWEQSKEGGALPEAEARKKYGNAIRRAWTHKALNRLAQGSSADIIKMAMHKMWKDGLPILISQIHDELTFSLPKGPEGEDLARELKHIMETIVTLKVPIIADVERGPNWGAVKSVKL